MSDLQLERSVLEAKERDELFAIALALGSQPAARTKKADLVSQILQVTGVEESTGPAIDKPRRPRARRATANAEGPAASDGAEQLELASASVNGNGHVAQALATDKSEEAGANGATATHAAGGPTANGDQA